MHQGGGRLHLVLSYPLKTVALDPAWAPVFQRLAGDAYVPLAELAPLLDGASQEKLSRFLDRLALKGYLDRAGGELPADRPFVSVIIPVRNRPEDIDACLASLQGLDYPRDRLEIIVVDDASDDETPQAAAKHPVRLIRLKRHRQASFCRNLGARLARGDILAFIDSDCVADPLWLRQLLPAFNDPTLAALGGRVDAWHRDKPLDRYEKAKSSLVVSSIDRRTTSGDPFFYVPACNLLIRKRVFRELRGFNHHLIVGEDVDLCWRLQKRGYELEYRREGIVYHKHRNQIAAFCGRRFDYGTSEPLLQNMHSDKRKTFLAPPGALAFWAAIVLWLATGLGAFAALSCLALVADVAIKMLRYRHLPVGPRMIGLATLRAYAAFAHHVCAFVSRYYLIAAIIAAPFLPVFALVVLGMHLLNAVVEYRLKRPALGLPWFCLFFTLEQLSYQAGVWWGCLRHGNLFPLIPRIVLH